MIIGFTGTQVGMTKEQIKTVRYLLRTYKSKRADHGDCIGADAQFHKLCQDMGIHLWGHPASGVGGKAAHCKGFRYLYPEKPPLKRNRDIVDCCDLLIAAPKEFVPRLRSGTWSTIRYAAKVGKSIKIVFPDGSVGSS